MSGDQFTGERLVQALASGALTPAVSAGVTLVGMVKASETPGCVAFTPAGCESWVDVPSSMIESAQHIGERRCDDHRHPVVRMTLKEPANAEARVLHQLLAVRSLMSKAGGHTPYPAAPHAAFSQGCHNFCDVLLRNCIKNPQTTSAQCVFLYENCWRACDVVDWFGGIFDGAFEQ
jgi:hypothetical protein